MLGIDTIYFQEKLAEAKRYSPLHASVFLPQMRVKNLPGWKNTCEFPGFFPEIRTMRTYPYTNAAHLLGYVTEVDSSDIKRSKRLLQRR